MSAGARSSRAELDALTMTPLMLAIAHDHGIFGLGATGLAPRVPSDSGKGAPRYRR